MKIEEFNRALNGLDVFEDLKNDKIHMVFAAVSALTFFNAFAVNNRILGKEKRLSSDEAKQLCRTVNQKNESATLYPKLNISLLPLTRHEERDDWKNEVTMKKNIEDVFVANSKYIKSQVILFAFEERHDFNDALALKVLESVANDYSNDGILEHIYYVWR